MAHGNEHLQVQMNTLKGKVCVSVGHTMASITGLFFCFCLVLALSFKFGFVLDGGCKGRGCMQGDVSGIRMHDVRSTKKNQ